MLGTFTHTGWCYSSRQLCNCVIGGVVLARRSSDHLAVRLLIVLTSPHSYRSPVDRVTGLSAPAPAKRAIAKRFRAVAHHDRPPFSGPPSLTGHCGHGWTCQLTPPLSRLTDPERTTAGPLTNSVVGCCLSETVFRGLAM